MTLAHLTEAGALTPEYVSGLISSSFERIHPHLLHTRLVHDELSGLYLKCEHEQHTGSFKWRGALSKLSTLQEGEQIVTASTGNHGLAVSNAAKIFGLKAKIFLPSSASKRKIEKLRQSGADLVEVDGDSLQAELRGQKFAEENNLTWVSPYNDELVIAGQGTIGLELDQDLHDIDRVYVTVGGGGLISGIASWMKHHHPHVEIIGCQPLNSPEMYLSTLAGEVVNAPEALDTLSDGSAGPLEEDSITFPVCKNMIDRFVVVDEEAIKNAIRYLYDNHGMIVEGAAGVAMAAGLTDIAYNIRHSAGEFTDIAYNIDKQSIKSTVIADNIERKPGWLSEQFSHSIKNKTLIKSVVILCGANIDPIIHQRICS